MDAKNWRFPMVCPTCKAVTGRPFRAVTHANDLIVSVRCDACQFAWEISAPAPLIFFRPKPDRRFASSGFRQT
jgi:hypothetical protein